MESKIFTNDEQNKRILNLGISRKTADVCFYCRTNEDNEDIAFFSFTNEAFWITDGNSDDVIVKWSYNKLLQMIKSCGCRLAMFDDCFVVERLTDREQFEMSVDTTFDELIDCIEWLIKDKNFNEYYLNK